MIKILKKYMKGAVLLALLAPVFMAVEVFMDILQPTYMAEIIDVGVAGGNIPFIWDRGKMMLLVAVIGTVGGMGCTIFSSIAAMRFGANLRQGLFDKIQTLSFKEIDGFTTSSLVTRLTNDVTQLQMMLMMGLRMLVRAPLSCIGGLVMAYMLSPKMSLIFAASLPLLFLAVLFIIRKAFPLFTEIQKRVDRVNTVMRENLLGVRVVKAFVGQEHERERFKTANTDLMDWSLRAANLTILLMPIVTLIMNVSVVALFWFGGNLAIAGEFETGKIMAFMSYLTQALFSLMMVVMMLMGFSRAQASAGRVNEVLDTESSITDPVRPAQMNGCSVEFDHVSFRYEENDPEYVLNDISFTVQEGQTVGIIGATGSGKSTLVSLIPRLYDVSEGTVRIGGADVRSLNRRDLRRTVGMVLQDSILFAGTVRENLRWADDECDFSLIEEAAKDAQAAEFLSANAEGYDAVVEQRGKNFSGGQKQRLSIARTFARRPRVLILDDSTSAVDTATEAKIRQAIAGRRDSSIVFIIAQRISAISRADKIIVLDQGRISGMGAHEELLAQNEIYRSIAVSQLGEEVLHNAG
ncbi:ABC transporter [Spirochaetia bacterium]|nr:ABC transporter [Spirochaetia bacterium]